MRIAQLSPLFVPVPPKGYGGTERVVSALTDELVRRGHEVTLFAAAGSSTIAHLHVASPTPLWQMGGTESLIFHVQALVEAINCSEQFDVIHSHLDYLPWLAAERLRAPLVTTLHGQLNLHTPTLRSIFQAHANQPLVSISDVQRKPLAGLDLRWMATIHHGLELRERYKMGGGDGGYLVFLGRIAPEKDPVVAIRAAIRCGIPIKLAAQLPPQQESYFDRNVRPLLDHPLVEWVGEQDDEGKDKLLGGALALIAPFTMDEPFGLVIIEALACGTPVVARPRGAVTEIVRPGEHGLLAETEDEIVAACKQVRSIDRTVCRRWAIRQFSVQRMARDYERVYAQVIEEDAHQLAAGSRRWRI